MADPTAGSIISSAPSPSQPTQESSSSPPSNTAQLQWLIALVPVVGAIILYIILRFRNARRRVKAEDEEGIPERQTSSAPHQNTSTFNDDDRTTTTATPPPSFTAHTLGRDRRGRIRIPARPLIQFTSSSSPLRPQLSNSSLLSSTSSFWRRIQNHNSTEDELDRRRRRNRRRRRRQRPPRTPPPRYPGSPPPKYEDVVGPEDDESLAQVQTRLTVEEHQQAEDEPLVRLQQRLIVTDTNHTA
ncbi:hypothetical protein DFQ28_006076 [Apophysomyces sp. BC1034]|nr:hypothetical protein DFQ30_006050 [Apophysomyces sp. BC1015]KAG0177334.1 hypothetical protein DFQ29_004957 [Apophysomyces sp. BC1021]KAG0187613.1 hypothetical protein DFQ28_006076 [Apophysomyces sp. BC1034]